MRLPKILLLGAATLVGTAGAGYAIAQWSEPLLPAAITPTPIPETPPAPASTSTSERPDVTEKTEAPPKRDTTKALLDRMGAQTVPQPVDPAPTPQAKPAAPAAEPAAVWINETDKLYHLTRDCPELVGILRAAALKSLADYKACPLCVKRDGGLLFEDQQRRQRLR